MKSRPTSQLVPPPFAAQALGLLLVAMPCLAAPDESTALFSAAAPAPISREKAPAPATILEDVAVPAGLLFQYFNGMSGELYIVEGTGGGAALFDYDGDGDLDLFLVQGAMLGEGRRLADALVAPADPSPLMGRLFRNDSILLPDGSIELRFTDVTEGSGIQATDYGLGVAVGDFTNSGLPDLYLLNFGRNRLYRNEGNGTFTDVTAETGTGDPRFSLGAAFADLSGNGYLDLYVVNYVDFRLESNRICFTPTGLPDYCGPLSYEPVPDSLYFNRGDGTFEDVSIASGVAGRSGPGMGVVTADLTGDGRLDVYVANDAQANHLWSNRGDGTFTEGALLAGCAVNRDGQREGSMGVDAADVTGDGREDLFLTHLTQESNTLYVNLGDGLFQDRSIESGLGAPSWPYTGWGTGMVDIDNDGWLDLPIANGAVRLWDSSKDWAVATGDEPDPVLRHFPLQQPNQLFMNRGGGRFEDATERAKDVFRRPRVSRGVAFGDVDNDGAIEFVVVNIHGPVELLVNRIGALNNWLGVRAVGANGRDMLGTRLILYRSDGERLRRRTRTDGSYASARDPRVIFGLGRDTEPQRLLVEWPSGKRQAYSGLPSRRYLVVFEDPPSLD